MILFSLTTQPIHRARKDQVRATCKLSSCRAGAKVLPSRTWVSSLTISSPCSFNRLGQYESTCLFDSSWQGRSPHSGRATEVAVWEICWDPVQCRGRGWGGYYLFFLLGVIFEESQLCPRSLLVLSCSYSKTNNPFNNFTIIPFYSISLMMRGKMDEDLAISCNQRPLNFVPGLVQDSESLQIRHVLSLEPVIIVSPS